jgi:hypothetical protein
MVVRAAEIAIIHRRGAENAEQAGKRKKKAIFCVFLCGSLRLCASAVKVFFKSLKFEPYKTGDTHANFDC